MADNKTDGNAPRGGSASDERKRNRRYLRNRKRPRRGPGGREQEAADPKRDASSADAPNQAGEQSPRQRRRRRARRDSAPESQAEVGGGVVDLDYVAPASVFIYTHVVRSGLRDGGYEFRSERFGDTGVGRRLEDYRLDLSVLFREEGAEEQQTPAGTVAPRPVDDRNFDAYDAYDDEDEDEDAYGEDTAYGEDADADPDDNEDESMTSQDGV